jgi:hypothetical protein
MAGDVEPRIEEVGREHPVPLRPGTIRIEVRLIRFEIVPGPAGDPIRLEGRYDDAQNELEESFTDDGDGWTYEVRYGSQSGWHALIPRKLDNSYLRLIVPRDLAARVEGQIGIGESELELGGLALTSVALETGTGEHRIRFSEPLAAPIERLEIDGSIGQLEVIGVGNASPEWTTIDHEIGEMVVDLDGAWSRDGHVALTGGIGDCRVSLPRGVRVTADQNAVSIGEVNQTVLRELPAAPDGAPEVTIETRMRVGGLLFE